MAYGNEGMEKISEEIEKTQSGGAAGDAVPEADTVAESAEDAARDPVAEGADGEDGQAEEDGAEAGGEDTAEADGEEAAESAIENAPGSAKENAAESAKENADSGKSGEKRGFFKKKKDKKDEQIEELTDKLRRQMAEFDNFRKRTEKEKSQMYDMGAKTIIEKMLPVVDNFERGLSAVPEEQKEDAFVTGMDKIYKQLMTELEAVGVTAIEAVGKEFDPEYHNAVMQVESGEYESGVVAQELQKGYLYKDFVVRHSMVAVVS